jgi:hypothetical protein
MKSLFFSFFLLMYSAACVAQSYSSLAVLVVEKGTRKPISNASFTIKESGWTGKYTGVDGKVMFDKSIPVGEIYYVVTRDGFQGVDGRFNITTEVKSNTLSIELTKTPLPAGDKVLIRGEVTDKNNADVEGVLVEVKVADIIKTDTTDRSGNYFIEVELNKSSYQENMVRIEAKDRDCKKIETVYLPRTNVINKDFTLECSNGNAGSLGMQDRDVNPAYRKTSTAAGVVKKSTEGSVEVTVDKCEIVGDKMVCHFTYRNIGTAPSVELKFGKKTAKLTDEKGNTYESSNQVIGNILPEYTFANTRYELIRGAVVKGSAEFDLIDTKFNKIARLQIGEGNDAHKIYDIPVFP